MLAAAACGGGKGKAPDLVFANGTEPETLDPAIITGVPESRLIRALYEGLTTQDPATLAIKPGVAESWEVSPDGLTYTFHLRKDAKWSNGDPVTAEDFDFAYRRALVPETAAQYAYQLFYIAGAEDFNAGKLKDWAQVGVKVVDPYTIVLTLRARTAFWLELCAFQTLSPVNRKCIDTWGDDWVKPGKIVTNGAFVPTEWRMQDRITLEKNPYYWDKENVHLDRIRILPVDQANAAINLYETRGVEFMEESTVPRPLLDVLLKRDDMHRAPYLGTYFVRCNVTKPPFTDVRVRKAFAMAIDGQAIVEHITKGGELPAHTYVPPGLPGYAGPKGLAFDVEAARALLAEAGFPGGRGFPHVSYLYNTSQNHKDIAEVLQAQWEKNLGVKVELVNQEWKVYLNSQRKLDYQLSRSAWIGDYADPNTFLDMFVTGGGNNNTGWSNAEYDAAIRAAADEADPARRMEIFRGAEKLLVEDELPIWPIYYYVSLNLYPRHVKGIPPNILNLIDLKYVEVDRAEREAYLRGHGSPGRVVVADLR